MIRRLLLLSWGRQQTLLILFMTLFAMAIAMEPSAGVNVLRLTPLFLIPAMIGQSRERATPFEIGLPIPSRQLFLARVLRQLSQVWLPLLVCIVVLAARQMADRARVWTVLEAGALCTLAVLLPLSVRVSEVKPPRLFPILLWTGLAVGGGLVCYLLPPAIATALIAPAIVRIFFTTWSTLPGSFQFAPAQAVYSPVATSTRRKDPSRPGLTTHFPLWPVVVSALPWGSYLGVLSGFIQASDGFSVITMCLCFAQFRSVGHDRMHWVRGLPLRRRTLLLVILFANALPIVAGLVAGWNMPVALRWDDRSVGGGVGWNDESPYHSETSVPLEFWRITPNGQVPAIRSPWGETVQPPTLSILGLVFYNPYQTSKGNSQQFLEWQWDRATQAVNGQAIPFSERNRYPGDWLPVNQRPRMLILCTSALVVFYLYLVFVATLFSWHWQRRPSWRPLRILVVVLLSGPLIAAFATDVFYLQKHWHIGGVVVVPLLLNLLLQASQALPQSLLPVIAVAAVPVLAMYWLLERQFGRSEFIDQIKLPRL